MAAIRRFFDEMAGMVQKKLTVRVENTTNEIAQKTIPCAWGIVKGVSMPKALALADIHGNAGNVEAIIHRHSDAEYVFIAGDLTNFGNEGDARRVVEALSCDGRRRTVAAVSGNCDPLSVRRFLGAEGYDIEGKIMELPVGRVVGAGGGLKRAGITSFERTEDELRNALLDQLLAVRQKPSRLPLIVLTHTPPYGTNADKRHDRHVGSREFASLIQEYGPKIWICGHIHESPCVSLEDETLIVNPGPCGHGNYAIIQFAAEPEGRGTIRAELSR